MQKLYKTIINILFPILVVMGLVWYLFENRLDFFNAFDATWPQIFLLCICVFLTWVINSLQTQILLRRLGIQIGFIENTTVQLAMILGNYLPGRLGTLLRLHYFKRIYGIEFFKFGGIIALRIVTLFILTGTVGSISLAINYFVSSNINLALLLLFVLMTIFSIVVISLPIPKNNHSENKIIQYIFLFLSGFKAINMRSTVLWQALVLVGIQFFLLSVRIYISFEILNIEVSKWIILALSPMITLTSFLNITPGNLGVREWAIASIATVCGIDIQGGIFAGTIDRAILMICTLLFGSFALVYVFWQLKNSDADLD